MNTGVSPPEVDRRPGLETGAASRADANRVNDPSLRDRRLTPVDPLDEIARHVDGAYVVVVKVTGGKFRRRCYLSVAAAQRAADRATERGENATVYLAELKPLWKVVGGTS